MRNAIGSYCFAAELQYVNLSDLAWSYDDLSEAWYVRYATSGRMLGYITREMIENVIFTPESVLLEWIYRISSRCIDGSEIVVPDFELSERK